MATKFTGRPMIRSFSQSDAFTNHIIPREISHKAVEILSDKRNYSQAS